MSAPDRYRALFLAEAQELLAAGGRALGAIEHAGGAEARAEDVDALFRATHSLKGMCGAMGHAASIRRGPARPPRARGSAGTA